jgi:diguanylate cyclase (GGDEF)-like protein
MMTTRRDPALDALFRLLLERTGLSAAGLFRVGAGGIEAVNATGSLRTSVGTLGAVAALAALPRSDAELATASIAPYGFAAIFGPIRSDAGAADYLVLCDARGRRLTPTLASSIRDAAAIAAAIAPALPSPGRFPRRVGAVLPRDEAHLAIGGAFRASTAGAPRALLLIDLDRFRAVNEALGLAAGDAVLSVTAERLASAAGAGDTLFRLEGDRYVMLVSRSGRALREFAQGLIDAVGRPVLLGERTVTMQASIGIVPGIPEDGRVPAMMLRADTALRRAKLGGRNRFAVNEPGDEMAVCERSRLELDLGRAVAARQMRLAYQPYLDLRSGRITGREALLRWRHPTLGEIMPGSFVPMAENTGLILPIGAWALRTACADAAAWPAHLTLSVNISAVQFHQPDFAARVVDALDASGLDPTRLELEITETVLMRDDPGTMGRIEALIARGVRIALDDFGTGYTALAYLTRLPHSRVKLDRGFMHDLDTPATADLVRAIVARSRASDVEITAEGVETPEQLYRVRAMGFTHAQGFAVARPSFAPAESDEAMAT